MFPEPHVVALPAPAAGQGLVYQVEQLYSEQLLALAFTLVTSAAVGNRRAVLTYGDAAGHTLARAAASTQQPAGVTVAYTFQVGTGGFLSLTLAALTIQLVQLPICPLPPGGQLVLSVDAMDAADVISAPMLTVARRSLAGNDGHGERLEVDLVQAPAPVGGPAGAL